VEAEVEADVELEEVIKSERERVALKFPAKLVLGWVIFSSRTRSKLVLSEFAEYQNLVDKLAL
jgi:hypothetical protein